MIQLIHMCGLLVLTIIADYAIDTAYTYVQIASNNKFTYYYKFKLNRKEKKYGNLF